MEDILYPSKIELKPGSGPNEATLIVEAFTPGYGTTVGNALRRVLLTSLPGAAVTAVKMKGAQHEFSGVPNVKEDVLEILLNIKQLRLKSFSEEPVKLHLSVTGEKKVTAGDFSKDSQVEIVNPDLHIATITDKKGSLEMEITVERGRGWRPTEERGKEKMELGTIAVDALFSPIHNVGFAIEAVRVGDITNYDRLVMTIETDGTISPQEAVLEANKILMGHFNLFTSLNSGAADMSAEDVVQSPSVVSESEETENADADEKPKKSRKKSAE